MQQNRVLKVETSDHFGKSGGPYCVEIKDGFFLCPIPECKGKIRVDMEIFSLGGAVFCECCKTRFQYCK